jgi:pyruvate/2-oxoglutarate dehydrogenase complex dihydrolipoamide dehydrogenase (E3) component
MERSLKAIGAFTRRGRSSRFDVAVIGAGMGGWAGVRAARRRGKRVALFESGAVGGT